MSLQRAPLVGERGTTGEQAAANDSIPILPLGIAWKAQLTRLQPDGGRAECSIRSGPATVGRISFVSGSITRGP